MENISSIFNRIFVSAGIEKPVRNYKTFVRWPDVVGDKIASVTEFLRFSNGKVFVKVKNDSWRNELVFYKQEIIDKINRDIGSKEVNEIVLL
ncbi:DUF721 domain-containing protein [bacterium]|nr:DUF721 domain-containing protein [bacterium]